MAGEGMLDLSTLNPEQLNQLHEATGAEMEQLSNSIQQIQVLVNRFYQAGNAVESLGPSEAGSPALIPMASSMFVAGTLDDTESVVVNVGTGYYIEMSRDKGVDFCKRKVTLLKDQLESCVKAMNVKRRTYEKVQQVVAMKRQAVQTKAAPRGHAAPLTAVAEES